MAVVFISHSSRDKVKVDEIHRSIEVAGFDSVFLDHDEEKGIKTGEHWEQRLYSEIKRAHVMLLILSPNWIDSKWCFAEYAQAKALGKEIIPIIIYQGSSNEVDQWIDSYLQKSDMTKSDTVLPRVINRIKEISLETQGGFEWDTHRLPYPGMESFEAEDAAIFFGREEETREAIEKLTAMKNKNAPKFLNIVAASGMGKSSFLKAGILPQLNRSYGERWFTLPVMRPGKRPLYAFANLIAIVLNKTDSYKEIYKALKEENYQETLDDTLTELGHIAPGRAILFPLDQAEELYSLANTEEKAHFFKCLDYLLTQQEQFFTLWTLRADFLKEFQADSTLKGIYKTMELFALPPVRKENVVSIIKEPAVVAGIDIDERLIEKIKEDMQTTDALPLLALGLKELYLKHGKDKKLTLEAYKSLAPKQDNPLEHIVKQIAEEAIKAFKEDKEVMDALKDAFIPHLVRVNSKGEYIKITAALEELPPQAQAPLEALVKERLLIKKTEDEIQTIEIAHEALIRKWPLLQTWLQEAHEFLVGKSQLEQALQEYDKEQTNTKHKTYLTGLRLQKASNWLVDYPTQLTQKEKRFIKESREFEQKQAKRRKQFYTVSFIAVLLFGIFAAWQWREAKISEDKAEMNAKLANTEKNKAEQSEKLAIDRLSKIEYQKNNILGSYWVLMLTLDVADGKINYLGKHTKSLDYLDPNFDKKDKAINKLSEYFAKRGIGGKFDDMALDNFDSTYTKLVFRRSKYVAMELEAGLAANIWLWDNTELKSIYKLLEKLTSKELPLIFQRYKTLNEQDYMTFKYLISMYQFMSAPSEKKLSTLFEYNNFVKEHKTHNMDFEAGIDQILSFQSLLVYADSTKEFEYEKWKLIINNAIDRIINVSKTLYSHSNKHPSKYTNDQLTKIEKMYFYGIFSLTVSDKSSDARTYPTPERLYDKYFKKAKKSNLEGMKKILKNILKIQGDNYFALKKMLYIHFLELNVKKYDELVSKMISLFPTENEELLNYQKIHHIIFDKNKNVNLSSDEKEKVADYYSYLAQVNFANKDHNQSIADIQNALNYSESAQSKAMLYGQLSWYYLFIKQYKDAIDAATKGIDVDPKQTWIFTNLAHAYLFSGEYEKAKKIYIKYTNQKIGSEKKLWQSVVKEDYGIFRVHKLSHENISDIERILNIEYDEMLDLDIPDWLK